MPEMPKAMLKAGQSVHGFTVTSVTEAKGLYAVAYLLEHEGSGARLLHLHTADPENLFSVSFPTPPPDDTGLPHILEHGVLAGSHRFPVKEPFFEMVKMSMATFINAMTGPDCTYYPVASNVKKDLFNLADVYFDAVFHPLLSQQTFRREGHHLAPADKQDPHGALAVSGIVYNEMKGAFSSPESRLYRATSRGLLPDTIYGRESGGDPEAIPDLTYETFKAYHEAHYHPGNAYFFLYGDVPTVEHLDFLSDRLAPFKRRDIPAGISRQPRWPKPRVVEDSYPIGAEEVDAEKTYLSMDWLTGDATDAEDVALLEILGLALLGNEAAPLKQAIIESKLGADLIFSGFGSIGLEGTFSLGLKGSEPDRAEAFLDVVTRTLTRLASDGIDPARIEAAFSQAAYHYLEIHPMFPLHAMQHVLNAWLYGKDPLAFLSMREHLATCRARWEAQPDLFAQLIRERILDNPHRLTVILRPDRELEPATEAKQAARMAKVRAGLTDADMDRIALDAEELDRLNGQPNTPDALAKLPQLSVADLPDHLPHIPTSVETVHGVDVLRHDVFANGVSYLALDFDLAGLPPDQWAYLPRYADAIAKLGAAGMDYARMAGRLAAHTGGIGCGFSFGTHATDPERPLWRVRLTMKALDDQMATALEVLHDLLFAVDPRDPERLREVLIQARARYRTQIVHSGSSTAPCHASRGLTPEGFLLEQVRGLPQLPLSEQLVESFDAQSDALMGRIEAIRDTVLRGQGLTVSFTGSDPAYAAVRDRLADWTGRLSNTPAVDTGVGFEPFGVPPREGLAGPIQVAHCAQVMPAPHYSHPDEVLLAVGTHLVSLDYVMSEIRFKGNAYGASFSHDPLGKMLSLSSYRDPHVARTLGVFASVPDYVRKADWSQADIDRAIISVAKRGAQPIRPSTATSEGLRRHLTGMSPDIREARYARLREATPREVKRALLETLEAGLPRSAVCVVASRKSLEDANHQMPGQELAIEAIMS